MISVKAAKHFFGEIFAPMNQSLSSCGFYGEGRLARKANANQLNVIPTPLPPLLMFACGWKHNVFLTIDHQVYVCGDNSDGQIGPCQPSCLIPILSQSFSSLNAIWLGCGDRYTAILTEDEKIFASGLRWGPQPVELNSPTGICFISCGVTRVCGIGSSGELFVWECGSTEPTTFSNRSQFCDCAAGNDQLFALATTGTLYVSGRKSACGMGKGFSSNELVPVTSLSSIQIRRIFAYCNHSIAIDDQGRAYAAGANKYGQLGIGDIPKSNVFVQIHALDDHPIYHVSLGDTFTAFLTESLELYTCGDGDEYRLCNASIERVYSPSQAELTLGRQVSWMSCGCSHIIIAENLEDSPIHLGRAHFGLDGTSNRKRHSMPSLQANFTISPSKKQIPIDVSDYGICWTGLCIDDSVETSEYGFGTVLGISSRGVAVKFSSDIILFDSRNLEELLSVVTINRRCGAVLKRLVSRSGLQLSIDTSQSAVRAFGFESGDRVEDEILGPATVEGVFGSTIWFSFDDDEGRLTTSLSSDIAYIHKRIKLTTPFDRKIEYSLIGGTNYPLETEPCTILKDYDLEVGDLVQMGDWIGPIKGTFQFYAIIEDCIKRKNKRCLPSSLLVLRRFNHEKAESYKSLDGNFVELSVSCSKEEEFMPFDRVVTEAGEATLVGRKDGKWWAEVDEAFALGSGVGEIEGKMKLLRRICHCAKVCNISVDSSDFVGSGILPGDLIVANRKKLRVLGLKGTDIVCEGSEIVRKEEVSSIVYRSNLPAVRTYPSKSGNCLCLSVSLSSFYGLKFVPDDVVETAYGPGLIVGTVDSNVAIHIDGEPGVSLFRQNAFYGSRTFKLIERRAIAHYLK